MRPVDGAGSKRVRIVLSTVDSDETARQLAQAWVGSRRAACVSILPHVRSVYRWKGEICEEGEALLVIKTAFGDEEEQRSLLASLAADHPYEEPEFLVLDPSAGAPGYLAWVLEQVS